MLKPAGGTPITTMTAEVAVAYASINQGTEDGRKEGGRMEDDPAAGSGRG